MIDFPEIHQYFRFEYRARTGIRRSLIAVSAFATLLCLPETGNAAGAFNGKLAVSNQEFYLPWDGAGAAVFNPAQLSETGTFDIQLVKYSLEGPGLWSGEVPFLNLRLPYFQGSINLTHGVFAGFGRFENGSAIDGGNALYLEALNVPMAAYGWKGDAVTGFDFSVGTAWVIHSYNAFGAVQSSQTALDLGAHLTGPSMERLGRLHGGIAVNNLFQSGIRLPDDAGRYHPRELHGDLSLLWSGLNGFVDLFGILYGFNDDPPASEGPHQPSDGIGTKSFKVNVKTYGAEIKPIAWLGLKVERTWNDYWTFGAVLRTLIAQRAHLEWESDISQDKFLASKPEQDGRGYRWSSRLGMGM